MIVWKKKQLSLLYMGLNTDRIRRIHKYEIKNLDDFLKAADRDFVCAKYKDNNRNKKNFIGSDCICMDCDNSESDNPKDWKTPEDVSKAFPEVPFIVHYSRNHMKEKNGKAPRPKFHILFPTKYTENPEEYQERKNNILNRFPYFDNNAVDNARLFYGTENPQGAFFKGTKMPEDLPRLKTFEEFDEECTLVYEGNRNTTMHTRAVQLLKRYGDKELTYQIFLEDAYRLCEPPLEDAELDTIWQSAQRFYKITISKAKDYVSPEIYNSGNAPFVHMKKGGIPSISCPALASFFRTHFQYKLTRNDFKQLSMIYVYENGVYKIYSPDVFKGLIKKVITDNAGENLVKMRDVDETYKLLTTDLDYVSIDRFNQNEGIINFENGLLHVSSDMLELKPHDSNELSSIQLPCNWSAEDLQTPFFDKYIEDLSDGDVGTRKLIMELAGVAISNLKAYRMKSCPFFYGEGDTGKSVLKSVIEMLLGEGNYMSTDLKNLEERFGTGDIVGKRLIGSADMSFVKLPEMNIFKSLTGGDSIRVEHKGLPAYSYTFNGMLWFCMNKLPKFGGDKGQWVYDRIIPIHCTRVIPEELRNHCLLDHLRDEREGIARKFVIALQEVLRNDYRYSLTSKVKAERDAYMDDNDSVRMFFRECLERKGRKTEFGRKDKSNDIYHAYQDWCRDNNGNYWENQRIFNRTLSDCLGIDQDRLIVHRNDGNHYAEVQLKDAAYSEFVGF